MNSGIASALALGRATGLSGISGTWSTWIDPKILGAATQTNFNSLVANSLQIGGGFLQSTGAQNAEVGWDVDLNAGTYDIHLLTYTDVNRGIFTVSLNGTTVGTMDGYSASGVPNVTKSITGIVIATSGVKRLLIKMATKNPSSSAYYGLPSMIYIKRTS